jgi:HAD superfamily hydrolase (TIGR01509 family)
MTYAGIIFDFNGVLWWDAPIVVESWQRTAVALRGRPFSDDEIARIMHGRNDRDTMEYLAGRPLDDRQAERLINGKEAYYRELCLREGPGFRLSPGAEDLLDFLRGRGIPRTIATASIRVNVDFFVRQLRLERWFDPRLIVIDDGTLQSKPAPDFYLQAAENIGVDAARCVVVEDSLSGIQSARAAKAGRVIGVTTNRPRADLLAEGADETVENLGQLDRDRLFFRDR